MNSIKSSKKLNLALNAIVKTSFIVFLSIVVSKIFTYLYRIIIAKNFGPETYGLYSLSIVVITFCISLFGFGLNEGLSRYIPLYRGKNEFEKINYIIKKTRNIILISGIMAAILLFIFAEYISVNILHQKEAAFFLKIFSIVIPLGILSQFYLVIIRSFEKIGLYSFINNLLQNFSRLVLLLIFMWVGLSSGAITGSYLGSVVLTVLASYFVVKGITYSMKKFISLKTKMKRNITSKLISYSWPLLFLSILSSVLYWGDTFIIGFYRTAEEIGFYNAAIPIASLLVLVPDIFLQLFFPLIMREYGSKRYNLIKELSKQVQKWIFFCNLPLLIIAVLFPGALLNLLFGAEYIVAEQALRYLTIGSLFISLMIVPSNLLSMIGKSKLNLINIICMASSNIILNIFLVPLYGIEGAAISTMIVSIALYLIYIIQVKKYLSFILLRRKMILIFLASIIPLIIISYIKNLVSLTPLFVLLLGILFCLLYIIFVILFRGFDRNDLGIIISIKNKFF